MDVLAPMATSGRDGERVEGSPGLGTGPWVATVDRLADGEAALWLPGLPVTSGEFEAGRPRARIS